MTFSSTWFFITLGSASYALYRLQHRLSPRQRKLLTPLLLAGEVIDIILGLGFVLIYRLLYGDEDPTLGERVGEPDPSAASDTESPQEEDLLQSAPTHLPPEVEPEDPRLHLWGPVRAERDPRRLN